eukprot:TRINITY_DN28937_c0_g1_i1.p1 TRINITY_DN28937_c0_g1~~TRINITY_DN28937_c0_g1_i1.p1  ORF type:complete len:490 (+),score=41.53 TRINITY_DN28937_c0_g1_i1:155-1624(+)
MRSHYRPVLAYAVVGFMVTLAVRRKKAPIGNVDSPDPLCGPDVILEARDALGGETKDHLMEVLAVNSSQMDDLLGAISISLDKFSIKDLCKQAVAHIPDILHAVVPRRNDESCISDDCAETTSTSSDDLAERIQESSEDPEVENATSHDESAESDEIVPQDHEPTRADLLRRMLSILFRVFPSLGGDQVDVGATSLLETEGLPGFGTLVPYNLRADIVKIYQIAIAMTSGTLRRLNQATSQIAKWFKVYDHAIQKQRSTLRRHLSMVLDAMGRSLFKYEPTCTHIMHVTRARSSRNYWFGCEVDDFRACGTQENGRFVVTACPPFINSVQKPNLQAFAAQVLIHEHSHHFGSRDNCYQPCAGTRSAELVNNADSYAAFCMDVGGTNWRGGSSTGGGGAGGSSCKDMGPHCAHYKRLGYCSSVQNVKANCKMTCGLCGGGGGPGGGYGSGGGGCTDTDPNCAYYKSRPENYCVTSPSVKRSCKKSCGFCR